MKSAALLGVLGIAVVVALPGCSSGSAGADLPPQETKQLTDVSSAARRVNGDFDKLTPDEKAQVLQMANGNEKSARALLGMMAHPPNEGMARKHGVNPPR